MAEALVRAAADHGADAVNLRRIAICEQSSEPTRFKLAVEALLQARDLSVAHPHTWEDCRLAPPTV